MLSACRDVLTLAATAPGIHWLEPRVAESKRVRAARCRNSYNESMDKITSDCPIPVRLAVARRVGSHTAVGAGF